MEFPGGPWLGFHASTAGGMGSIPGLGIKIPHVARTKKPKTDKGTLQDSAAKVVFLKKLQI